MSCCGDKRQAWLNEARQPKPRLSETEYDQHVSAEQETLVFEYNGDGPFSIRGAVTGTMYHFRFKGDGLEVAYQDAYALMGEGDLNRR